MVPEITPTTMSLANLKPPKGFNFEGNVAENGRKWKQTFDLYLTACEFIRTDDDVLNFSQAQQSALFLHIIRPAALEIYNTIVFTDHADKIIYQY